MRPQERIAELRSFVSTLSAQEAIGLLLHTLEQEMEVQQVKHLSVEQIRVLRRDKRKQMREERRENRELCSAAQAALELLQSIEPFSGEQALKQQEVVDKLNLVLNGGAQ